MDPFWLKARHSIWGVFVSIRAGGLVKSVMSHIRTSPSPLPETIIRPVGSKTMEYTRAKWAWSKLGKGPFLRSHNRIFPSLPPAARVLPSGEKETDHMLTPATRSKVSGHGGGGSIVVKNLCRSLHVVAKLFNVVRSEIIDAMMDSRMFEGRSGTWLVYPFLFLDDVSGW